MNAWQLFDINMLKYIQTDNPILEEGEVLVRVHAAGICGSDVPRVYRDGAHQMPLVPGHEFSGEVVDAHDTYGEKWIGKRVGVFPLIPCRECVACKMGRHEMCRNYSYLGSRRDGGFAEYVAVPADNLIELPKEVSYQQAAMLEPMAVAVHAMRRIVISDENKIVICGLGTIGMMLAMFLLQRGVQNILVIGNKQFQREKVLSLGLDESCYCDKTEMNVKKWVMEKTKGTGADVFFECVGRNETVSWAVDLTCPGGKVCMVGNPNSDMLFDKKIYWKILRNQLEITGTWNSSFFGKGEMLDLEQSDWMYVLRLLENKLISPEMFISHQLSMDQLDQGLMLMRDKSEDYLKVMIVNP